MTSDEQPERIDADVTPDRAAGTASDDPIAGVRMDEEQKEAAVVPEDNSITEVDGPPQKHS